MEFLYNSKGVAIMGYLSWREENTPESRTFMRNYCQLIIDQGYDCGVDADELLSLLEEESSETGKVFMEETFEMFVPTGFDVTSLFAVLQ